MFGSQILDVAIGIVMLFLLLSLICSSMKEAFETVLKYRAKDLESGIKEIFHDPAMLPKFYNHPLVYPLFLGAYNPKDKSNLPSYIPAQTFALALLDLYKQEPDNASLKRIVSPLILTGENEARRTQQNIEDWYNGSMDRVSGWYKRRTQKVIAILGFSIAIAFNVDCVAIARYLNVTPAARAALINQATNITPDTKGVQAFSTAISVSDIPVGWALHQDDIEKTIVWRKFPSDPAEWFLKIAGLLATGFAISLGAPFWFDVLNKFMVVRSTVKPDEKSPNEPSKS